MRRHSVFTATRGRDAGKHYLIVEKPAMESEWWALRAFLALAKNGVEVPEGLQSMGMAGIAQIGIQSLAKLDPVDAKPLLDDMMQCVSFVNNPSLVDPSTERPHCRPLVSDDI